MPYSSEIVPDRSSPEHGVSANHHSVEEVTQVTDTVTVTEEAPAPRRTRPSRACTVRAQQRLQEQQAAERKFKQPKKEQKRQQRHREEVEDVEDREEEDGDESPRNEQQCGGGSAAKIVNSLVQPPEPSQVPRRSLRSMWELASLLNFLHIFRPLLNIKVEFSAEELETALLTPNDALSDVHIPLLKAIPPITRMALTRDTWVTVLCRKLRAWWHWVAEGDLPIVASHGLEIEVYKSLDPGIRVVILKALCDIRVEQEDIRSYIESSLKSGVHLSTFRKDRVGGDSHGVNFWYEDDSLIGHRLYREIRKAELGKVKTKGSKVLPNVTYHWETVATNFDEFQDVSEKLFSSNSRTEASLGKKLKNDMLLEIEKEHKRKERLLKKQHRQALPLDNFLDIDGYGAGRSLRDRKPVTYTFDDYDRSINEAIKITKKKPPSPEPSLHRSEPDRLEASENGGWTSSPHPLEPVNDTTSLRSSDFATYDDVDEERAESVDRSNRRRQRPQRFSTMDFVETVSDNEADFGSDDDIVGEAVYDDEYLKKRKQRKDLSSASEGDEEYRWEEDNAIEEEEEEEEDSLSTSEEDSDEPQRFKKLPRRDTKLRSRSNHLQPGLRRSKRATRVNYQQYELSESENEATRPAKFRRLVERDEPSDETENDDFSMGSQESEENANDPETKVDEEEEPIEENDKGETNHKENDQLLNKPNGTEQEEVKGVGKRRYLDLNELAPVFGFDDGPNTVLKDDKNNTDNS